jgi:nucleotide-binding universal stress UspA family protein
MYQKILVALNLTGDDWNVLDHVRRLALHFESEVVLLHVADGWAARNFDQLKLAESEEMKQDREALEQIADRLRSEGLSITVLLARGSPPEQILKVVSQASCDLIAMTTHGHRFLGDLIHGSTIAEVRHRTSIPVLLVRAKSDG